MTPERWRQTNNLLQEALDRSPAEREALLDKVCSDDPNLRKEVESLLSFHERAGVFLETPALETAGGLLADDLAGSLAGQLIGSYKIETLIGTGGMGEVYLAEDTRLDRKVAIKFLSSDLEADELARRRQIREAKAAAKLDHQNICTIHEVADDAGRSFIVMQYVEGKTLASIMQSRPMELGESLDVSIQVADALSLAHSRGVVHRDIKPQNVMITPQGQVKVLDFGLAKVMRQNPVEADAISGEKGLSAPGLILGTAPYMSPEQAKGAIVDGRSDLFSLGVLLYECVTGKPAFGGDTPMEICAQVIHVDPPAPSQINSSVRPELDAVILKALAKDPDKRYQSGAEMLGNLRALRTRVKEEERRSTSPMPSRVGTFSARALRALSNVVRRRVVFIPGILVALILLSGVLWPPAKLHQPSAGAEYFYNEGTAALREGLYYKASKSLKQAVKADDDFALAHARLAEALAELDYADEAKSEVIRAELVVPNRSKLPPLDGLYLDAITKTVLSESASAIESYQEIARQVPDADKSHAYFGLGVAYERDDQLDKAKVNYQEATRLNSHEMAAFLRLGVLCAQQLDTACAEAAFSRAEELYDAVSNSEGVTEVLYQRGLSYSNLNRLAEARAQLQRAFDMAQTLGNKHQQTRALLELSRVAYNGGETMLARRQASEAMEMAQANAMENLLAQGLIEIGNAMRVHGDYFEAGQFFEKALEFAQKNKGRRNEARARVSLGGLRITLHDADQGIEYIKQALPFYEKGGYRREAAMAFYQFGRAYELKGDIEASRQAHDQQLRLAQQVNDPSQLALAHRGIAVALVYQENYSEALLHFQESCSIYRSLDNQLYAGNRLIDCGEMLWHLGRYEAARGAFNEAISIADQPSVRNKQMWDSLSLVEAQMELSARQFSEAISRGKQALALNAKNDHAVEAKSVIGLAKTLAGAKREGMRICLEAVEAARRTTYPPILSNALLALAEAMIENGDAQHGLTSALEARDRFASAGKLESEWRALQFAARASLLAGDAIKAREYATEAERLLSNLQEQWGTEAYSGYLTRPDVQQQRRHLIQLVSATQ